jgi:hypothetical protein
MENAMELGQVTCSRCFELFVFRAACCRLLLWYLLHAWKDIPLFVNILLYRHGASTNRHPASSGPPRSNSE